MRNCLPIFALLFWISLNSFGQGDNSLKVTASLTGLGACYEFNPAKVVYVEGGLSTAFTVTRANLQSKILLFSNEKMKVKLGVEGAFIFGTFNVGSIHVNYYDIFNTGKQGNWAFMPLLSVEGKILGIEVPVIVNRNLTSFFPVIGITLNVSKDKPANKTPRKKKIKNTANNNLN